MSEVTEEEVEALIDVAQPAADATGHVEPRDFRVPRRLGAEQLHELQHALAKTLPALAQTLQGWLRTEFELQLVDVGEVDALELFDATTPPFCATSFRIAGKTGPTAGWLFWEPDAALRMAEAALGAPPREELRERPLSAVERRLLERLGAELVTQLCAPLELKPHDFGWLSEPEQLEQARDELANTDTQRLTVQLDAHGLRSASSLRLVLPSVVPARSSAHVPSALPNYLDNVPVEIGAFLGAVDISLSELLALEVGDVIALGVDVNAPLDVHIEDRPCATAVLGQRQGNLVLRLQDLHLEFDEET